jgi:hypothetical protein
MSVHVEIRASTLERAKWISVLFGGRTNFKKGSIQTGFTLATLT